MSGVELRGITPNQQSTGTTKAAGSPAEREYAAAVKELARLQRNLASSAAGGDTSEEKLAADQQAVTLAAARGTRRPSPVARRPSSLTCTLALKKPRWSSAKRSLWVDSAVTRAICCWGSIWNSIS